MRAAMVLVAMAMTGCAATSGDADLQASTYDGRCSTIARQQTESVDPARPAGQWLRSIDPQVALSAYQLHCMKDTPLGL